MRKTRLRWALLVIGLAVCGAAAFAQGTAQTTDWGKRELRPIARVAMVSTAKEMARWANCSSAAHPT